MRSRLSALVLTAVALAAAFLLEFATHADSSEQPGAHGVVLILAPAPVTPVPHLLFPR